MPVSFLKINYLKLVSFILIPYLLLGSTHASNNKINGSIQIPKIQMISSTTTNTLLNQMRAYQTEAKREADKQATEYMRLQNIFDRLRKPKTGISSLIDKSYQTKHRTVEADLKELNAMLRNDISKLLAPLPTSPTQRQADSYRDLLMAFKSNSARFMKGLRDEIKWIQGDKNAKFENFRNYDEANKFFSRK